MVQFQHAEFLLLLTFAVPLTALVYFANDFGERWLKRRLPSVAIVYVALGVASWLIFVGIRGRADVLYAALCGLSFAAAAILLLCLVIYVITVGRPAIRFSSIGTLYRLRRSTSLTARHILVVLRGIAITLLVCALARPQAGKEESRIITEGIDIVLGLDVSTSMRAEDFVWDGQRHNRLYAAKMVVKEFVKARENDRIGMVVFAGHAYTQCPMTLDYEVLLEFLDKVEIGMIEDGTAIGSAIAASVARLRGTKAKSKVLILLTDGRNNRGKIDPATAADIAKTLSVKIYAVGAGTTAQYAPYPRQDPLTGETIYVGVPVDIDEKTLRQVAQTTGGKYFRASDTDSLRKIYKEIDKMEKTKAEMKTYTEYDELFPYLTIPALCMILLEIVLANTRFRRIP